MTVGQLQQVADYRCKIPVGARPDDGRLLQITQKLLYRNFDAIQLRQRSKRLAATIFKDDPSVGPNCTDGAQSGSNACRINEVLGPDNTMKPHSVDDIARFVDVANLGDCLADALFDHG